MHGHRTPQFLDDPLPTVLGPTLPELLGLAAGAGLAIVLYNLTAAVAGQVRLLVVLGPPVLLVIAVFALYQGRTERYPQQMLRYTWRTMRVQSAAAATQTARYARQTHAKLRKEAAP